MKNKIKIIALKTAVLSLALALSSGVAHAVEVSISGQVNRLLMNIDNGEAQGVVHADNTVSGTRWRFEGRGEVGHGMTAGLLYENQLQSNPSDRVSVETLDGDGQDGNVGFGDYFYVRQSNVWLKGNFGRVQIGQGSGASDGSAEIDLSGTNVIQYSGASTDLLGSMEYGGTDIIVYQTRSNFDGLGRNDNLRYDAAFGPVRLAASTGNGSKIEFGALYELDNFKVALGLWDQNDSGLGIRGQAISASWMAENGFNVTAAWSGDEGENKNPNNAYLKLGYRRGNHAFAFDVSETRDLGPADAGSYSIAWVGLMLQGVELYATYRVEKLDQDGADDIVALAGGARIKF